MIQSYDKNPPEIKEFTDKKLREFNQYAPDFKMGSKIKKKSKLRKLLKSDIEELDVVFDHGREFEMVFLT